MTPAEIKHDAVVIGSGPNGLSAAITIAQAGHSVLLLEAEDTIGGGTRSAELTLPGFVHDVCSAVHPMALASPFFRTLPLAKYGLAFIQPDAPLAHPLDDGTAVVVERSVEQTAAGLGRDRGSYANLIGTLARDWPKLESLILGPLRIPKYPVAAARFGLHAFLSASALARSHFRETRARALFAGMAAHSMLPLEDSPSAAFGLVLAITAHALGWPIVRGGSQKIADALAAHLRSLGGEIRTGARVSNIDEYPAKSAVLCDVSPRQLSAIAGAHFTAGFRAQLARYRYGPGVCKVDYALDAPIPWTAKECARAGTVHVGGTFEEIAASEHAACRGVHSSAPFVLLSQPTLFDSTRAPAGKHIAWAYCHVPNGSSEDASNAIEAQIERFAPGFRARILKRSVLLAADLEAHNANLIGGDIGGGAANLAQFFTRPTWRRYATTDRRIYICSASSPPGAGVHGMCGHLGAQRALRAVSW